MATLATIVPCLELWDSRWPGCCLVTGEEVSWKDGWRWSFFIAWLGYPSCCRQFEERVVAAADGERAARRMLQTLADDADSVCESVTRVELYHVREPLTAAEIREIEAMNRIVLDWHCGPKPKETGRVIAGQGQGRRDAGQPERARHRDLGRRAGDGDGVAAAGGAGRLPAGGRGRVPERLLFV